MERKNYITDDLTKEEKSYLVSIIKSTRNNYLKKNFYNKRFIMVELKDNIPDEMSLDLDVIINNAQIKNMSAGEFENVFLNAKLYKIVKALSLKEKMMLFSLFNEGKSIRYIAKEQKIDKNTVIRKRKKFINLVKEVLEDEKNV